MYEDDSPFYLAVNNNLKGESLQTKEWFKVGPVGINKLNRVMKNMAQKAGINNERLRNHSGRKTMIQTLSENDIPLNLKSKVSTKQQMKMSQVLSSVVAGPATKTSSHVSIYF